MKHLTLFELTDAILDLVDDIVDASIAGDEEELNALYDELSTHYGKRASKHEGYVHVIKNAEATAKASVTLKSTKTLSSARLAPIMQAQVSRTWRNSWQQTSASRLTSPPAISFGSNTIEKNRTHAVTSGERRLLTWCVSISPVAEYYQRTKRRLSFLTRGG